MSQITSLSALAEIQAHHHDTPGDITLRYDASRDADGDPVVYAVLHDADLVKLPTDLLSGLGIGADSMDQDGDPVFFVGDETSLRLYVDTDRFENFKADLVDIAEEEGLVLMDARGDLALLRGGGAEISVPDMPAFVHAGMERVETTEAIATIAMQRDMARRQQRRVEHDDPGSQLH